MIHRFPRHIRRLVAQSVLALYALPAFMAIAPDLVHGVHHVAGAAHVVGVRAAAVGLVHTSPRDSEAGTASRAESSPLFVHTHDGSTHGHGPLIAAMTWAADTDDGDADVRTGDLRTLSPHRGVRSGFPAPGTVSASDDSPSPRLPGTPDGAPVPPPPRG